MSFINSEDDTKSNNIPKLVNRTVKVSTITRGLPLRKPHLKDKDSFQVNCYSNQNQSIVKKEVKSPVDLFNCNHSVGDIHKDKITEPAKFLKSEPSTISPKIMKKDVPDVNPEPEICHESKILFNGSKNDYELKLADSNTTKNMVEFLQKKLVAKCQFKFTGNGKVSFDHPVGVAELKSKEVVVADTFANRLLLFSEEGEFIRQIASSSVLKQPSAIVVLADGKFAVRSSREITVFSPDCTFLKSFGSDYLKRPYGIAEDGKGNIITVDTGLSDVMNIVFIDVTTGNLVKKLPILNAIEPKEQFTSKPRFITFRPPSTLLVVDLGLDKVHIINLRTGRVVKSFGSSGTGLGEFRDPSGIACEADGFILIGDSRNHRIQIFTPCGEFVCVLRMDRPLRRPSGISLTPDGHLFVLNYWENSLVKYLFCMQE